MIGEDSEDKETEDSVDAVSGVGSKEVVIEDVASVDGTVDTSSDEIEEDSVKAVVSVVASVTESDDREVDSVSGRII